MNTLNRVTITGADDNCDQQYLIDLSSEFPFVEWGILVSRNQEGGSRFPSRKWIDNLCARAPLVNPAYVNPMMLSMHVCGGWVREMLTGDLKWKELPSRLLDACQRIQINTHAEPHVSQRAFIECLKEEDKEYIFQWDGVNDHLAHAALAYGIPVSALFDTSHGAGVLATKWPMPAKQFWCGYAGGLGPENVAEQIPKIAHAALKPHWIDMEGRVRTNGYLDFAKVRRVLEIARPFIETQQERGR